MVCPVRHARGARVEAFAGHSRLRLVSGGRHPHEAGPIFDLHHPRVGHLEHPVRRHRLHARTELGSAGRLRSSDIVCLTGPCRRRNRGMGVGAHSRGASPLQSVRGARTPRPQDNVMDRTLPAPLVEQLDNLPQEPGVYQMLDASGTVLYVGKAIDLRSRVRSYFQPGRPHSVRTDAMVERAVEVRTIIVRNESEALLLECNLIKQHKPPFNVRLKDDKKYPYLKVTLNEPFPRIIFTRKLIRDGSRYFGPFSNAGGLRDVIDLIRKVFPLRTCKYDDIRVNYRRPCLQYHIHRCMAPCAFLQTREEYAATVHDRVLVDRLKREMEFASEQLAFEHAARLRDRITDLERVMARQEVVWKSQVDMDLIAGAHGQGISSMDVFFVRGGKLIGQDNFLVEGTEGRSPGEVLAAFVSQFYAASPAIPKEIMLQDRIPGVEELARTLSNVRGNRVRILVPER